MNPLPLFLLAISLPLLLGGCGEESGGGLSAEEVEDRDGIAYFKGSDIPYTGKVFGLYPNGQKEYETVFLMGEENGKDTAWVCRWK